MPSNDAIPSVSFANAPLEQSSFNHQYDQTDPTNLSDEIAQHDLTAQTAQYDPTVQSVQTDLTYPTVPTELDQDDDELVNIDPVEENWLTLRSHLIEQYCLRG